MLAAQAMGADFAYIGSAFIATEEAHAAERYKQAIVDGSADDIVYTNLFTGVHGNYLKPSIVARRARSRQPAGERSVEDEFRLGRQHQGEGLEGHLGLRPGHRRGEGRGERRPNWWRACGANTRKRRRASPVEVDAAQSLRDWNPG